MNKKTLNDSVFSIQGVNPGFNLREDSQTHNQPQTTPGKVVLKRLIDHLSKNLLNLFFIR